MWRWNGVSRDEATLRLWSAPYISRIYRDIFGSPVEDSAGQQKVSSCFHFRRIKCRILLLICVLVVAKYINILFVCLFQMFNAKQDEHTPPSTSTFPSTLPPACLPSTLPPPVHPPVYRHLALSLFLLGATDERTNK